MRRPLILLLLALTVLLSVSQDRAGAALYWLHGFSSVGKANLDGSLPLWPLPNGGFPALEAEGACGLAIDAQHLYWGNTSGGAVGRATIDGTAPNQAFISGLGAPCGVAVTGTHVYWSDFATNMIGRANLDGGGVEPAFAQGASDPCGIAVDGAHVYWANQDGESIGRAKLDGSDVDQQFISGLGSPCGVAVGGGHVYWGDQELESVGRAALDGSDVETTIVDDAGEPWDVAVSDTHVFWADRWGTPADPNGGIGRASLDGGGANHDLIPGLHSPTGVAVDSRLLVRDPSPARPSDYLRFGKLTRDRMTGTLQLIVHVPARGEFTVDSPAIGWSIDKGDPSSWVGGTFRWKLRLWPGKGRAGKRIRRQLRRKGRAPIILRATYQQEGRLPLEGTKRLAFLRR
jgi:virginiamycin B lyase